MRALTILRRSLYTLLAAIFVLFAIVQFQQHLLRRRAERLHAEILALQLHPDAFVDIKRLQREWGRYGDYEGSCTDQHCLYRVELQDAVDQFLFRPGHIAPLNVMKVLSAFGERGSVVTAAIGVQDKRLWRANFHLMVDDMFVRVNDDAHLFKDLDSASSSDLIRGYSLRQGHCTGCVLAEVHFNLKANPTNIIHFSTVNFDCLTRFRGCQEPHDALPNIDFGETRDHQWTEADYDLRSIPIDLLAREVSNILLVTINSASSSSSDGEVHYSASAQVIEQMKSEEAALPEGTIRISGISTAIYPSETSARGFVAGMKYLILFGPSYGLPANSLNIDMAIPFTQDNLLAIQKGISQDASAGVLRSGRGQGWP